MPKVSKDSFTPLQEQLLLVMDYIERRAGEGGLISGQAIAHVLGGRWSDHRAKTMQTLADAGWVTVHTMAHDKSGKRYYMLTEAASISLADRFAIPTGEFIPASNNFATIDMFGEE
jgi:hypothetical protein